MRPPQFCDWCSWELTPAEELAFLVANDEWFRSRLDESESVMAGPRRLCRKCAEEGAEEAQARNVLTEEEYSKANRVGLGVLILAILAFAALVFFQTVW